MQVASSLWKASRPAPTEAVRGLSSAMNFGRGVCWRHAILIVSYCTEESLLPLTRRDNWIDKPLAGPWREVFGQMLDAATSSKEEVWVDGGKGGNICEPLKVVEDVLEKFCR